VFEAELDEHRVDGSDLDTATAARVSDLSGLDMVLSVRLQKSERGKSLDQWAACFGSGKALQQFLQHQTGCKDLVRPLEGMPKCLDFRYRHLDVAAQSQRPNAGIDKQAHGLRARSAL